ncbi:hypothetical protein V8B97DRAFT_1942949 [Scleroderma yunnanense]
MSSESSLSLMNLSPSSPMLLILSLDSSMSIDSDSTDSISVADATVVPYTMLLHMIQALCNEV